MLLSVDNSICTGLWRGHHQERVRRCFELFLSTAFMTHRAPHRCEVSSPVQVSTVCLSCQPSGLTPAGVLSLQPYPVTGFLDSLLESFCHVPFLWTKSCHSHPLCDACHNESSAANFDWEMRCFPPRLLTFSNKSLDCLSAHAPTNMNVAKKVVSGEGLHYSCFQL